MAYSFTVNGWTENYLSDWVSSLSSSKTSSSRQTALFSYCLPFGFPHWSHKRACQSVLLRDVFASPRCAGKSPRGSLKTSGSCSRRGQDTSETRLERISSVCGPLNINSIYVVVINIVITKSSISAILSV